ncbi:hypothetical protein G5I_04774 [Acromyrmex echinatior]|uniref:SAP domain-containing protein n=1 Tax=Acromyrmex echinatior TaxID=103372 RepID=F4WGJ3_ACREC|nr:hypothetical protein G5I_04774 [Acromyrmex echinatior]
MKRQKTKVNYKVAQRHQKHRQDRECVDNANGKRKVTIRREKATARTDRDFEDFTFKKDTVGYVNKIEAARKLSIGDLISCCNILGLEYSGNREEIISRILHGLMDLDTLTPKNRTAN